MNKLKFAFLALLGIAAFGIADVHADRNSVIGAVDGWRYTHMGSSGSVFVGVGEIGAIFLSSGPSTTVEFGVGVDTNATTSVPSSVLVNASQRVTPSLVFNSTLSVAGLSVGASQGLDRKWDASTENDGLRVTNGFYWFSSAVASGESIRAIIKWRP